MRDLSLSSPILTDYWKSLKGLLARLADISHSFVWGTFNAAQATMLADLEADPTIPVEEKGNQLSWTTMDDDKVCDLCQENEGDYEPDDPLLPDMPAHVICRCYWSISA
jgi:hypothetical protein